jgi:hypothetical protein
MDPREVRQKELLGSPWGHWKRSWRRLSFALESLCTLCPDKLAKHRLLPFATRAQLDGLNLKQARVLAALANLEWRITHPGPTYKPHHPLGWSHAEICEHSGRDTREGLRDHLAAMQNMGMLEGAEIIRNDGVTIDLVRLKRAGFVDSKPDELTCETVPHLNGGSNSRLFADEWLLSDKGRGLLIV